MHRVVAVVHAPQPTFELGCAVEVFGTERPGIAPAYDFAVCAERPGRVMTADGYELTVRQGLSALTEADTVIIPGWRPVAAAPSARLRRALVSAHTRGARIVTVCSGVFPLARTGLLDGRAATTHPDRADQLRREFPGLRVETGVAFVDHGDVATSAGAGAGLELFLHLVRRDLGAGPARRLARHMAMPAGRIDPAPALRPADEGLERLLSWAEPRLGDPLRASELAAQLNVSSRTLARRFAEHVGTTPGAWLLERRLAAAQALLERTDLPVEAVAARVGLGSAVNLRRRFRAHLGRTPAQYRRESRSPAAAVARR